MADPHSASDDILSSIRRLIVDEGRVPAGSAPSGRDKLVLTLNLRVVSVVAHPMPTADLQPLHLQTPTRPSMTTPHLVACVPQAIDLQAMEFEATLPVMDSVQRAPDAEFGSADSTSPADQSAIAEDLQQDLKGAAEASTPAPILSEQVLQDLVRDLVRDQFRGDLGLHITRSIRKLVKAEIAREMDQRAKD